MTARRLDLVIPGDLATPTGGYAYARRIIAGLSERGWRIQVHALDASFPRPSSASLREAERLLGRIPAGRTLVIDGLALGAMPALVEAAAPRLDLIALIHHPLALETGLEPAEAERLRRSEFRALASVRGVITTSRVTADGLTAYGVSRERTRVVEPGTDAAPLATGSGCERLNLLCVATLTPRKGHAILFEALSRVRDLSWRLACVGSAQRDPAHAQALRARIGALDLADRIQLVGQVDAAALANHYQAADACVLASHHEGYGMVLAEALAQGLPILSTTAGAIVHTVPETAGLLVPPGDVEAMAAALRRFLTDRQLRERLRAGALRARASLPSWNAACDAFADAVAHPARVSG